MSAPAAPQDEIVDKEGKPTEKLILTFEKAFETYKNFVNDNRDRNNKNAAIQRKRDGEQPWSARKLKAAGQSWRSNRPTGFMQSLLKRLMPPYKQMVDQLPKLTFSHFPSDKLGTDKEKDIFQKNITDTIRAWSGWADLISQITDEDITFGYAAAAKLDQYEWKPKMHRGDEAYFYVGCPQNASEVEIWGLKEDMRVHDAIKVLSDPQSAADAGWQLNNLVAKLNGGTEKQFEDYSNIDGSRVYEDLIRENNLASSFTSSIKVLKLGHIFSLDPEGGVNHYIFDRNDGVPIFFKRQQWSKMEHCLSLFSAEVGDRTLHGSKGAGRALYNTHVSVEQARNLINDALHLSGLLILKKTTQAGVGTTEAPGLTVNHPFAVIGAGYDVIEKVQFNVNSEAFFALDRHATSQAEIQVGAFMPGAATDEAGQPRTASEVNYVASIDAQIRAGILARFADQLFNLINQMQRAICHPEVIEAALRVFEATKDGKMAVYDSQFWDDLVKAKCEDGFVQVIVPPYLDEDAIKCVVKMLEEGMTQQQILILANQSSRANVDDAIAAQSGILDVIVARYGQDKRVDGIELTRRDIASKMGGQAADRLMNVDLSPLSDLKQARIQLSELTVMLNGNDTPVDPTDDHIIHLSYIVNRIQPMIADPTIAPLTSSQEFIKRVIGHADGHIQMALQQGIKPDQLKPFQDFTATLKQVVQLPPVDGQAQSLVNQATAPGAAPAVMPPGSPTPASPVAPLPPNATPGSTVAAVANPPRPTPP